LRPEIQQVIKYIHTHLGDNLTVRVLAGVIGRSGSHFYVVFKEETGMSPTQYVRQVRMERARYLLDGGMLTIKEIQSKVGFSDRSQFAKSFKAAYGITPFEYQRLVRVKRNNPSK
jgi:AraC-like DNA-binding protein